MPNFNSATLAGHLTRDIELKHLGSTTLATGAVAVSKKWTDKDGAKQERASFIDFKVWGKGAEIIEKYVGKGDAILLSGELEQERWEKDGQNRSRIVLNVREFQFLGQSKNRSSDSRPHESHDATRGEEISEADIPF